jgi:hypothetical protein
MKKGDVVTCMPDRMPTTPGFDMFKYQVGIVVHISKGSPSAPSTAATVQWLSPIHDGYSLKSCHTLPANWFS